MLYFKEVEKMVYSTVYTKQNSSMYVVTCYKHEIEYFIADYSYLLIVEYLFLLIIFLQLSGNLLFFL